MAILITGGAGFIGVQLAREFLKRGEDIVIFDKVISDSLFAEEKKVTKIKGDITNWPDIPQGTRYPLRHNSTSLIQNVL